MAPDRAASGEYQQLLAPADRWDLVVHACAASFSSLSLPVIPNNGGGTRKNERGTHERLGLYASCNYRLLSVFR